MEKIEFKHDNYDLDLQAIQRLHKIGHITAIRAAKRIARSAIADEVRMREQMDESGLKIWDEVWSLTMAAIRAELEALDAIPDTDG